ncbi:IS66 family insertion sequence element accessory protein TnpB [Pseudomonas caricapapayae]|uniref:IS66 family insertion sequence element accessory protein TnpB n=1 Tax=Pseudomonas caricapapayae TaxID=46678 RepID=A0ACC7M007_9PSED
MFDSVFFVFLNRPHRAKILYWQRNGFCHGSNARSRNVSTLPEVSDEAIVLTVQELNWLLNGLDLW